MIYLSTHLIYRSYPNEYKRLPEGISIISRCIPHEYPIKATKFDGKHW
jgi:hypothetical protein